MKTQDNLVSVICNRTMHFAGEFIQRKAQTPDYAKLTELLRGEIKAGYVTLMAELKEASDAFHGNEGVLNMVLNTGCAKFAADAIAKIEGGVR